MPDCSHVLLEALRNPASGWWVGTFGAIGESLVTAARRPLEAAARSAVCASGHHSPKGSGDIRL